MNRTSSDMKYILKDGKYVVQSATDQQLYSHRARSDYNESVDSSKDIPVKDGELARKPCYSSRQPSEPDMTASAILPLKLDYLPKHFATKKIGKNLISGQISNSLIKPDGQPLSSRIETPMKLIRSSFDELPNDTKSNDSEGESEQYVNQLDYTVRQDGAHARMTASELRSHKRTTSQGAVVSVEPNIYKIRKESNDKYRMSPQQQVVWLKRMLENKNIETEKLQQQNYCQLAEIGFLKERIGSFQRANHVVETENTKLKTQMLSKEELMELCNPDQNLMEGCKLKTNAHNLLQQEVERLKQQLHQLETQTMTSDTRSEVLNHKAGTRTNQKINHLRKVLAERKSILQAQTLWMQSKESMKCYITNIIERAKVDHKIISQLRSEVSGKEKIIAEMDHLIHQISTQLATYKNEIQKADVEATGSGSRKQSKSMKESMLTNASTTAGNHESPALGHSLTPILLQSEDDLSVRGQQAEDVARIRSKLEADEPGEPILKLVREAGERQQLIAHYQNEIMRLSQSGKNSDDRRDNGPLVTEIEVDGEDAISVLRGRQDKSSSLIKAFEGLKNAALSPIDALMLLRKIPRHQLPLLNLDSELDPEDLLVQCMVVPPICIRPSVLLSNEQSNEDDLTMKIKDALVLNMKVDRALKLGEDYQKFSKDWYLLQSVLAQYINSDTPGLPLQEIGKKPVRSLCVRLKGKQGRFRQNLSGKRSNFTGRTVISPDPNLHPTQVIVPAHMSKILTISVPVTERSIEGLRACVQNGTKLGGANYVVGADGSRTALGYGKITLKIGDTVQRHLRDDDIVIFNRQPSLHRISMMGFRVKISSGNTLRFNECVCTPFNADFDGDEMNIHLPQTLQARSETFHLMGVAQNIMTPKNGEPIIALIQDFLTTAFLLTDRDVFFTREEFARIVSWITDANQKIDLPAPSLLKPKCLWTGKQVVSCLLRPNRLARVVVNLQLKEKTYSEGEYRCYKDGWVVFKNSELLLGQIGKATLGGNKSGLLYALIRDNSQEVACEVMHRFSKLSSRWITNFGMTIGISDVTPSKELKTLNGQVIEASYGECQQYIKEDAEGTLQIKPGMSAAQSLESYINQSLSKVRETIGKNCQLHLDRSNKPLIMSLCGSKGNPLNLSQMIGCVGQQTVGGKRIAYGFLERTLPHFARHSKTPEARGFVKNSFFTGLEATEFFFHTMGGREGLIDTAVKTAETGYMQRRLIKLLEDVAVMYDMTVRTCDKKQILQFRYGGDGLNPMRSEEPNNPVNLSHLEVYVKNVLPRRGEQAFLSPARMKALLSELLEGITSGNKLPLLELQQISVHLDRVSAFFQHIIMELERQLAKAASGSAKRSNPSVASMDSTYMKNRKFGFTERQLRFFVQLFCDKLNRAVMEPGETVGAITAQSIGEPATQMTLKTFHFAGIASMNITQGVPRINEIINCAPNISTPIITVKLKQPLLEEAILAKGDVESLTLGQITESIEEVYSSTACYLSVTLHEPTIRELQLQINIKSLIAKLQALPKTPIKYVQVGSSNSQLLVHPEGKSNVIFELKTISRRLMQAKIAGIASIKRALISKDPKTGDYEIFAEGLGLKNILAHPKVDASRTLSNHILEVYDVLGIEATRKSIIKQVADTMKEHGVTVDIRHIILLADLMTCKGRPIGFTRYGVDKMKDSTMMLASFEKTTDFLFDAATQGKHDRMRGISQRIIIGKPISIGTGMFDIAHSFRGELLHPHQ